MYHLKYYVIFMIGIFLSLGIGVMIGITLESKDILDRQQSQLIKQIEENFITIKKESLKLKEKNENLGQEIENYRAISGILLNETVKGRLNGLNVAFIDFNKSNREDIVSLMGTTGANIIGYVEINYEAKEYLNLKQIAGFKESNEQSYGSIIAQELVYSLVSGEISGLVRQLKNADFINFSIEMQGSPAHVILLIPDDELVKEKVRYDTFLIEAAIKSEVPVVVLERTDFKNSLIPQYKSYGISSVDHIDTLYGKLSLVSILTGNKGNYGVRRNTDGIMPEPLFFDFTVANKLR